MAIHRFQTSDGKIHRVEAPSRGAAEAELNRALGIKPSVGRDVARSGATGLSRAAAGISDTVMQASPLGMIDGALKTAGNLAGALKGQGAGMPNLFSPGGRAAEKEAYQPQTVWGDLAHTAGTMVPNLFAPGSMGQRVANFVIPTLASEGAGQAARASGADRGGEAIARGAGALGGAAIASVRPRNLFANRPPPTPVERLGARSRQDPAQMRQRAADMRAGGVDPTLVDVVDDAGRGAVRAAANRQTPGRQLANDFSRNRTANLPDRLSTQARRTVSNDPRTPDQIRAEMVAQRGQNADRAFGAVRGDTVQLAPEGVQALRTDYGRAAIREAAQRERDPDTRAALNRLANAALDDPSTPVTVGMADRISRVLLGLSEKAARDGDNDLATTLGDLGRSVRGPTAQASPGYRAALDDYGADTRLTQAAGVGEDLMRPNTDEFVDAARRLSPEERSLALAAGRRAVERKAGENPSAAAGVARRLADAPEQQARNAALMGDRANPFQNAMRQEALAVENANAVAPRTGSSTFLNAADDGSMARQTMGGIGEAMRGRWGALGLRVYDAWRTRGMSDDQVEQLVRVAIDPNQTDAAIAQIAQRLAPQQRQELMSLRQAALVGALSATAARPGTTE